MDDPTWTTNPIRLNQEQQRRCIYVGKKRQSPPFPLYCCFVWSCIVSLASLTRYIGRTRSTYDTLFSKNATVRWIRRKNKNILLPPPSCSHQSWRNESWVERNPISRFNNHIRHRLTSYNHHIHGTSIIYIYILNVSSTVNDATSKTNLHPSLK